MTHQLHCVVSFDTIESTCPCQRFVNKFWQYMMARIYSGVVSNITESLPDDYDFHFLHCVDYLRQSIMCSADLALEAHEPTDSDDLGPLDGGWNSHHGRTNCFSSPFHCVPPRDADSFRSLQRLHPSFNVFGE